MKSLIRERRNPRYAAASVTYHVAAAGLTYLCVAMGPVFVLLSGRAALAPRLSVTPKQIGLAELGFNVLVVAVALLAT